ncbi:hypothetical protein CCMA1212_008334 [Trichoderma ghanense]|uniref:Heterokaryon incompatibility domain-containing protein n=1 Tax=Trichoderma ghanense TaxID=65468 RepID=A0ABY2GWE8_9HYPO
MAMTNISDKIARVADLSNYTDITPDKIKKVFEEIGSSPEKLRAALNLWFVPDFKPTFTQDAKNVVNTLQDIEYLELPDTERPQRPLRMIDIDTGNIVDAWNISYLDSYCILSHRWKGDEITLAHFMRARKKHLKRSRPKAGTSGAAGPSVENSTAPSDDVSLVLEQCTLDLLEQEEILQTILEGEVEALSVEELIRRRVEGNEMKWKMNSARQARQSKKTMVDLCEIEKKMFDKIIDRVGKATGIGGECKPYVAETIPTAQPEVSDYHATTSSVVRDAIQAYDEAEKTHEELLKAREHVESRSQVFQRRNRLGDEVDELIRRLQRWKSAVKLHNSIKEARRIFQTSYFQTHGARYIWSDTCCIDKMNYGELSTSLSLMGDWYSNAEFCLVHLDKDCRETDAIDDWVKFHGGEKKAEGKMDKVPAPAPTPNIRSFKEIPSSIEWATRAWTLQELVMSKMTYFTNSEWQPLSRPIDTLGKIYPLIPFIALYTGGPDDAKVSKWDAEDFAAFDSYLRKDDKDFFEINTSNDNWDADDRKKAESVTKSLQLVAILNALGFSFPANMTVETATSEISRAVYLASSDLVESKPHAWDDKRMDLMAELKALLGEDSGEEIINFLIAYLATKVGSAIIEDRRSIARFGHVQQLKTWEKGVSRSGFPAHLVLQLSGSRNATVAVDHVYSLMGILGVRFPSFHAEGYAKALSRLLDEVIVTYNDVSVFNWAGAEMGSPVRGRSMYPASHKAYGKGEDRGRRYNMMISAKVRQQRRETMTTYHGIIHLLREAIDCVKDKKRGTIPLHWVREIASFIDNSTFEHLKPQLESIGKVLLYIKRYCDQLKALPLGKDTAQNDSKSAQRTDEKSSWSINLSPSLPSLGPSSKKVASKLPGFGMGKDIKSSFGKFSSKSSEKAAAEESAPPSTAVPASPPEPEWKLLDSDVMGYLRIIHQSDRKQVEKECLLPQQVKDIAFKMIEPEGVAAQTNANEESPTESMTCPNPIIVNSSGIEGIFDIQRIVVTMIDREKLVRQVAKATSPKQKISGWCTISTGFANVAVHFACEQRILKTQLDVEKATEDTVIKEDARAKRLYNNLELQNIGQMVEERKNLMSKNTIDGGTHDNQAKEKDSTDYARATKEEKAIVRMLDYIQEPQLQLVAGEWVLARFSGVAGAKWFLCFLELGSTHQFYGQRIASTEVDFSNSAVEPGLMSAWHIYMDRKKRKMCKILDTYIKSSEKAMQGEEKLSKVANLANDSYDRISDAGVQRIESARSFSSMSPLTMKFPFSTSNGSTSDVKGTDSESDSGDDNFLDDLLDHAKEAAVSLGHYTVLAAYEKFFEMRAQHLDKYLAVSVLKKTPKILQSAVENLDENKGFLPAMFHSGKRIHMF